jgi:hypothetical protein
LSPTPLEREVIERGNIRCASVIIVIPSLCAPRSTTFAPDGIATPAPAALMTPACTTTTAFVVTVPVLGSSRRAAAP